MKKAIAIMLLIVFFFNVGGYFVVLWALKMNADETLLSRLDTGDYEDDETIELKVPLSMPYPFPQQDFERVNGKFEHNGEYYKLVKQRLHNDTLYIVCIRDQQSKHLERTMHEYANLTNNIDGGTSEKAWNFLTKLLKDFNTSVETITVPMSGWSLIISRTIFSPTFASLPLQVHSPPPKA